MRCNVKIVGIGKRRTGTSKAGRDYDFVPVSILFVPSDEPDFKGERAETVNFPIKDFIDNNVVVGEILDVFMHWQNYALQLDGVVS